MIDDPDERNRYRTQIPSHGVLAHVGHDRRSLNASPVRGSRGRRVIFSVFRLPSYRSLNTTVCRSVNSSMR